MYREEELSSLEKIVRECFIETSRVYTRSINLSKKRYFDFTGVFKSFIHYKLLHYLEFTSIKHKYRNDLKNLKLSGELYDVDGTLYVSYWHRYGGGNKFETKIGEAIDKFNGIYKAYNSEYLVEEIVKQNSTNDYKELFTKLSSYEFK